MPPAAPSSRPAPQRMLEHVRRELSRRRVRRTPASSATPLAAPAPATSTAAGQATTAAGQASTNEQRPVR